MPLPNCWADCLLPFLVYSSEGPDLNPHCLVEFQLMVDTPACRTGREARYPVAHSLICPAAGLPRH